MTRDEEEALMDRRVEMEGRFVRMESQIDRLVSDAESEKGTRQRIAEDLKKNLKVMDERLTKIEHKLYWGSGIITTVVILANWYFRV
jgi:hypothetical protein